MKARNRKTGEIVDIIAYSQYVNRYKDIDYVSYIDSQGIEHDAERGLNFYWDFEEVEESKDTIDWEERRYQIAKAAMQGLLANSELTISNDGMDNIVVDYIQNIPYSAVCYADALIKELKGE